MIKAKRRTMSFAFACFSAVLVACASKTTREDRAVAWGDLAVDAGNAGDADSAEVTLCHMPRGNPENLRLLTVGASAVPALQAQGDGVCSSGATDCCLEPGPTSRCTNLEADPANCGACGTACPGPSAGTGAATCTVGVCGLTCANPTSTLCRTACVDESSDPLNCGACGNACPSPASGFGVSVCSGGSCGIKCGPFTSTRCNDACVNTDSDSTNCGACGNVCDGGKSCCGGTCVDLATDNANCSACGVACSSTDSCVGGVCACATGQPGCSACNLEAVAPSPIPTLYGSAPLTGFVSVPSTTVVMGQCVELASNPTTGTVRFAVGASGCSISYVDSSVQPQILGPSFSSYIPNLSFDGDTYTCDASATSASASLAYELCPELRIHSDGLNASVSLSVQRSTGMVRLSRECIWSDATCSADFPPAGGSPATAFTLGGSLSCPAAGGAGLTVSCGTVTCPVPGASCCSYPPFFLHTTGCVPSGTSCAHFGELSSCSESAGCPSGFVCCAPANTLNLSTIGTVCQAFCPPGMTQLP